MNQPGSVAKFKSVQFNEFDIRFFVYYWTFILDCRILILFFHDIKTLQQSRI